MESYTSTGCPFEQHGTVEKPAERFGWVNKDANTLIYFYFSSLKHNNQRRLNSDDQVSLIQLADT